MSVEVPIVTREDALAAYRANKLYDMRGGSLTKCEAFIDACRFLLEQPLRVSEHERNTRLELAPEILERSLRLAEAWYHANYNRLGNTTSSQRYADFSLYRD